MKRLEANPLVTPADVKPSRPAWEVVCAFNPGVARLDGETILLLRVAERPKDVPAGTLVAPIWDAERGEMRVFECREDNPILTMKEPRCFVYGGQLHLTSISHLRVARSTGGTRFTVEDAPAMSPRRRPRPSASRIRASRGSATTSGSPTRSWAPTASRWRSRARATSSRSSERA